MKKGISLVLAVLLLTSAFAMSAGAATGDPVGAYGICNFTVAPGWEEAVELDPAKPAERLTEEGFVVVEGQAVTYENGGLKEGGSGIFYPEADRITVLLHGLDPSHQYLMILQSAAGAPTEDNIAYIDQKSGLAEQSFTIFPFSWKGGEYHLYLSESGEEEREEIASFLWYVPYVLGDVNGDGVWNAYDALLTLQYGAGLIELTETQKLAADVNGDGVWNAYDALKILQYGAGLITSF